jgi:hypothetical protein
MSKKLNSIIVVFFTFIYLIVTLYLSKYDVENIGSLKARQVINSIRNINIGTLIKFSGNKRVEYREVKQSSEVTVKNNTQDTPNEKKYTLNITKLSKEMRIAKLQKMYLLEKETIDNVLDKTSISDMLTQKNIKNDNKKSDDNSKTATSSSKNNEETAVFNNQTKLNLTLSEKERLLSAGKKLSPIDQEKINRYLQSGNNSDMKIALNLLRDRLSDKEFQNIKDIGEKLNNK